ncbi:MAG: M56 family metallopeptidase, partial [Planctomycetota bacterium]
ELLVSTSAVFSQSPEGSSVETAEAKPAKSTKSASSWCWLVFPIAFFCIGFGILRLLVGYWQIRLLRRSAITIQDAFVHQELAECKGRMEISGNIEVRETKTLRSAAVVGWRSPLLLLPANWRNWTAEERQAVLAHELAHVKRRDFLSTAIGQLAVAVNFYHPLAHLVLGRLRLDQELAADSLAASVVGGQQRYVELLSGLALRQPKVRTPGPCQAFLPPRRMFVRRLEMLRSLPQCAQWLNRCYSSAALLALVLIAASATGLRPHFASAQEPEEELAASSSTGAASKDEIKPLVQYITPGLFEAVAIVNVQSSLRTAGMAAIRKYTDLPETFEIDGEKLMLADIDHILIGLSSIEPDLGPVFILRSKTDFKKLDKENGTVTLLDSKTLAFGIDRKLLKTLGPLGGDPRWVERLERNKKANIQIAASTKWIARLAFSEPGSPLASLAPLWKNASALSVGITLGEDMEVTAQVDTSDSKKVAETLQAVKWLARNYLEDLPESLRIYNAGRIDTSDLVMATSAANSGTQFLDSLKIEDSQDQVVLSGVVPNSAYPMLAVAMPSIEASRTAALRTQSSNNLRQMALALLNYESAYRRFPPAVIVDKESGEKRSWRVEILPYIEQMPLYNAYRKDEPWDSPNNLKILAQMPKVFAFPGAEEGTQETPYQAIVSEDGALTLDKNGEAPRISQFTDGTSNTISVVETKQLVPWTKPVDLVADAETPKLGTARSSDAGILAAFVDGSVRFIGDNIDPKTWKALITRSGGELIDAQQLGR